MKDFAAEFEATAYEEIAKHWLADTDRHIAAHPEPVRRELIDAVEQRLAEAARRRTDDRPPAAYLTFSVLYASVYFGRPQLRMDLYDKGWVFGETQYTAYLDLPWLFALWQAHREEVAAAARACSSRISPRHIQQMLWRSVRLLTYLAAERMKYWSAPIAAGQAFQSLAKDDAFSVSWGEYLDWQKIVYAILPPIDIFNREPDDALQYRDFDRCVYRDKTFRALDLSGSRFRRCTFENAVFENVELKDCRFEECVFRQTAFRDVRLLGMTAANTIFDDVSFSRVTGGIGAAGPVTDGIYKEAEFQSCRLHNVRLEDTCFAGASLPGCLVEQLTLTGGDYADSDFAFYLHPAEHKAGEA